MHASDAQCVLKSLLQAVRGGKDRQMIGFERARIIVQMTRAGCGQYTETRATIESEFMNLETEKA